jgi:conjugative transfer region protein TrbK
MNVKTLVIIAVFSIAIPAWAAAPTIDQLVANPTLLNAEMDRCKDLCMAANDDARCQTAWQAGNGVTYTPKPVDLFRNTPAYVSPGKNEPTSGQPSKAGSANGQ